MSSLHQITLSTKRPGFQNWKTDYFYRDHRKVVKLNYKKCQPMPTCQKVCNFAKTWTSDFRFTFSLCIYLKRSQQWRFTVFLWWGAQAPESKHMASASGATSPMPRIDLLESTLPPLSSHSQVAPELERSQISLQWSLYPGMIREQVKG